MALLPINFILFLISCGFCFTLPGFILLNYKENKFNLWEKLVLGSVIGLVLFTLLSYLQTILRLPYLTLLLVILTLILFLKNFKKHNLRLAFFKKSQLTIFITVLLLGIAGQMAVIVPSGLIIDENLVFWSAHGHDGPWHISLMEEVKKGGILQNPVFAGERLVNYHFFSDIAPAYLNMYFKFSPLDLYFRFFPFFYSLLLGPLVFLIARKISNSFSAGIWSMIYTYFAGSFGYIVTFLHNKTIGGEALFWATQVQSSSGNPPQISSIIIFLTFLYLFTIFKKIKDWKIFLSCTILIGSLAGFKIYASVVLLLALFIVSTWQILKERSFNIFLLFILSSILSLIIYFPNSSASTSFLILEPWWFIRTMVVATDKLNWLDLELRRQTYIAEGNLKRVIQLEGTAFLIFFFGNLGMRFLGLFSLIKLLRGFFNDYFKQLIVLIIIISFTLPMLFLQKGVASNTSQFLQYFLLIMGILAGVTTAGILSKIRSKLLMLILSILIFAFSVPTQASLIYSFYSQLPLSKISKDEMEALSYLKKIPTESIILTPSFNKNLNLNPKIPSIWDWYDTSYVSAFSAKRTFLADQEQVTIMGYDLKNKLSIQEELFKETSPEAFDARLKATNINLIYFPKIIRPIVDLEKTSLKKVFENQEIEIWQIN